MSWITEDITVAQQLLHTLKLHPLYFIQAVKDKLTHRGVPEVVAF